MFQNCCITTGKSSWQFESQKRLFQKICLLSIQFSSETSQKYFLYMYMTIHMSKRSLHSEWHLLSLESGYDVMNEKERKKLIFEWVWRARRRGNCWRRGRGYKHCLILTTNLLLNRYKSSRFYRNFRVTFLKWLLFSQGKCRWSGKLGRNTCPYPSNGLSYVEMYTWHL